MNDLRLAFIRARLSLGNALEEAIAVATHHREDVVHCVVNLFVELVGIPAFWDQIARDLRRILVEDTMKLVERRTIISQIMRTCLGAKEWLPFIAAWNMFGDIGASASAPQSMPSEETFMRIQRGDFRALGCSDTTQQLIAHLRSSTSGKAMPRFLRETINMLEWTSNEPTASNLRRFAIFSMIRAMDPRPRDNHGDFAESKSVCASPSNLDDAKCAIICASSRTLCAIAPGDMTEALIDRARARMGNFVSLAEDRAVDVALARTPLLALGDITSIARRNEGPLIVLAQLRADTFIGFDTPRRIIAHGPLSDDEARACINYARICGDLGVPRSGRNARIARVADGLQFFVFDIDIARIPTKIARPHAILREVREPFIINCLWRAVMNFAGRSASADLLVVDGQIFGYNEHRTGLSGIAAAHREVLDEFAHNIARYEPVLRAWEMRLREIARIESIARIKFPDRARMTGIDAAVLAQCAERAARIADAWRSAN